MRLLLGLFVESIIQINSRPKQNWKTVCCFLKKMSLHRIKARGDTKCQNLNSFFLSGEYIENEKL